jgi:hypothetical protein
MKYQVKSYLFRIIGFIFSPRKTWNEVKKESSSGISVFTGYVLPLLFISGLSDFFFHLNMPEVMADKYSWAVLAFVFSVLGDSASIFLSAYMLSLLGYNYKIEASYSQFLKIISYSITAFALVSALVKIVPELNILYFMGFYSFYILYVGLDRFFTFPENKKPAIVFISILLIIVIFSVVGILINFTASAVYSLIV